MTQNINSAVDEKLSQKDMNKKRDRKTDRYQLIVKNNARTLP